MREYSPARDATQARRDASAASRQLPGSFGVALAEAGAMRKIQMLLGRTRGGVYTG